MAVFRVGGIFLAEAAEPKYGGIFSAVMHYGGNVLAVGGFSFCLDNDFGGRRYYQIRRSTAILPGPPTRAVISRREKYRRRPWKFPGWYQVPGYVLVVELSGENSGATPM